MDILKEVEPCLPEGTFFLAYRGSIAHGMYVPNTDPNSIDDKDIMGICVPNESVYFGLRHFEQQETMHNEWDSVVYEARKFISLLCKQNPNVLSLLWTNPEHVIIDTPSSKFLRANKNVFVSKKAHNAFCGYAHAQINRMKRGACNGYMGEKRKRLVEQFGYDPKNLAHTIRLLRMGIEYLKTGELNVDRRIVGDADELLAIKLGHWTLEQGQKEADRLFKEAESAYATCPLPEEVNLDKANRILCEIVKAELKIPCTWDFHPA